MTVHVCRTISPFRVSRLNTWADSIFVRLFRCVGGFDSKFK